MKYAVLLLTLLMTACAHTQPLNAQPTVDDMYRNSMLLYCDGHTCSNWFKGPGEEVVESTDVPNGVKGFTVAFPEGMYSEADIAAHSKAIAARYAELVNRQ